MTAVDDIPSTPSPTEPSLPPTLPPGRRWTLRQRFILVLAPTTMVLVVYALVEAYSHRRLLFTSIAASAFLIYTVPEHRTSQARTVIIAQFIATVAGFLMFELVGVGYLAAGAAMMLTIFAMVVIDVAHPPAVGTALALGYLDHDLSDMVLFLIAVLIVVVLVFIEHRIIRALARRKPPPSPDSGTVI